MQADVHTPVSMRFRGSGKTHLDIRKLKTPTLDCGRERPITSAFGRSGGCNTPVPIVVLPRNCWNNNDWECPACCSHIYALKQWCSSCWGRSPTIIPHCRSGQARHGLSPGMPVVTVRTGEIVNRSACNSASARSCGSSTTGTPNRCFSNNAIATSDKICTKPRQSLAPVGDSAVALRAGQNYGTCNCCSAQPPCNCAGRKVHTPNRQLGSNDDAASCT